MKRGLGVMCEAEVPLEIGAPWGWGCDKSGVGWEFLGIMGIMKWCWEVRGLAVEMMGWGAA